MVVEIKKFSNQEALQRELISLIKSAYDSQSNKNSEFDVGLSGGSLPNLLVKTWEAIDGIDWKKWRFFFCDERCVSYDSPDSTYGVYRDLIFKDAGRNDKLPISLSQFVTIDPSLKSSKCADDYLSKVRKHFNLPIHGTTIPTFDILFLGVGPDGHTCSLFPNHRLLKESSKWVAFIGDSPKPPPERITLTLPVINNAKLCIFVATGSNKAEILKEIFTNKESYPAGLVDPQNGKTVWLVDDDAGALLDPSLFSALE